MQAREITPSCAPSPSKAHREVRRLTALCCDIMPDAHTAARALAEAVRGHPDMEAQLLDNALHRAAMDAVQKELTARRIAGNGARNTLIDGDATRPWHVD